MWDLGLKRPLKSPKNGKAKKIPACLTNRDIKMQVTYFMEMFGIHS
jgi:hypothetical protein